MGRLEHVEARVDSPRGLIQLNLVRSPSSFMATGRIPDGTLGRIGIPRTDTSNRFVVNGESQTPDRTTSSFSFFDLGPGEFAIETHP
jgi:hypothetical protein